MKKRIFALAAFAALGAAHAQAPVGDAVKGRAVFARCATCHLASGPVMIGPSLVGVVGRKAGTVPGVMYSPALKSSGIVWDDAKLGAFIANPSKLVPGTSMAIMVSDAKERADVIAYVKTLK